MRRYQTASHRASGESAPPSGWVSARSSYLSSCSFGMAPWAGPNASVATTATQAMPTRVTQNGVQAACSASPNRALWLAWCAMPGVDFSMATSFVAEHRNGLTAAATLLLSVLFAQFVDRQLTKRGQRVGQAVGAGELSPVAVTRLRLVRRLVFTTIILIGVALALAQFPSVKRLATGLLASSAVLGLIVGFAARQTLANGIAGILLAITQPIGIGDLVTFEESTGEVEDVRLTYPYIRLDDGTRLIVPNERLAQSSVLNHTILDARVQAEVSIWLPADADLEHAIELIEDPTDGISAVVAESTVEGVRLSATTWADTPAERGKAAVELRRRWLRLLREHGLSSVEAS